MPTVLPKILLLPSIPPFHSPAPRRRRPSVRPHVPFPLINASGAAPPPPPPPFNPLLLPRRSSRNSSVVVSAGRSKKKPGGPSSGRIEGNAEVRRLARENARRRARRIAENRFYRRSGLAGSSQADAFTEEELEMIGLGYDRSVRFMEKDDPRLRHPYDWYKYGRYGPYSWRGIVVGPPIRGRFSDDRVTLMGTVRDHEEWEQIERFEMADDFSRRLGVLEESRIGMRYFWVFVRHPKWRPSELPWVQWTLAAEVAVEAGRKQRLDKWSLMGRFGNKTRALVTQCAAWERPDIIYVKRPVYQCRFEPQDDFFRLLGPLLDPETEGQYLFDLQDGSRIEKCTYFGGLCRIVNISQKAYVDDVVNAYSKLSDENKSRCLEFLLNNHPMELLHPYTKEWKAKLEEMELGCDAPDESDDEAITIDGETEITDWIEEDDEVGSGGDEEEEEEDEVIDVQGDGDDVELGTEDDPEESPEYWKEQWKKAMSSPAAMEKIVKKSMEVSDKYYAKQMMDEKQRKQEITDDGGSSKVAVDPELIKEEWERAGHRGPKRKVIKSKIPPELFLRAAVRPFNYRNLVKEIVLLRHAIIDGDVSTKKG